MIAAVGGSNAIGAFAHYLDDEEVQLIGVEPVEAPTFIDERRPSRHSWFQMPYIAG